MANAQDDDPFGLYPVAQDIRPNGRHLAHAASGIATALGELGQTVGDFDQATAEPGSGSRIE